MAVSGNWVLSPVPMGVWVAPPLLPADFTKVPAKSRVSLQPARLSLQCPKGASEMSPRYPRCVPDSEAATPCAHPGVGTRGHPGHPVVPSLFF